jgi:hypothetical protein
MSKVVKQPVKFGGGSEPVVTGTKYQIPFDGQYVKYDDGSKVFKWSMKTRTFATPLNCIRASGTAKSKSI